MGSRELINVDEAVAAYFARIKQGIASPDEIAILPQMLDKYHPSDKSIQREEKRDAPKGGLVSPEEVVEMLGRKKMKKPCVMLIRKVREEGFPAPFRWETPYRWLAQDVLAYIDNERSGRKVH